MSEIAIRVENLSKLYHIGALQQRHDTLRDALSGVFRRGQNGTIHEDNTNLWALKDVSLEVKRGEVLGIIGRNGAGKSTLLKILSRITEPTSGTAEIHGRVGSLLEVGTGFHPELTGRENIYLNGAILGMKRTEIDRQFDEIVAFAEIEKFLDTPVKRYSSGMYVRLAFAVAAHLEPEILLVDEVLAVGDAEFQKKCLGKMDGVAKQGRTVFFVSHNMAAVRLLCTRAILLDRGHLTMNDRAYDVVNSYLTSDAQAGMVMLNDPTLDNNFPASVKRIYVLCNGVKSTTLMMGDELAFEIEFKSKVPIRKPSVGYLISSIQGEAVLNANNIFLNSNPLGRPATDGTIRCELGAVPLMENRYVASFWFGADEASEHQFLENVVSFDVIEADVWGQGRFPTKRLSSLWWPTSFEYSAGSELKVVDSEAA